MDFGHDVADYRNVDSTLGTRDDFHELIEKAKESDIKIILDMVPNHTSDQHPWFLESVRNNESIYRDFYVWRNCNPGSPPNNWVKIIFSYLVSFNSIPLIRFQNTIPQCGLTMLSVINVIFISFLQNNPI